MGASKQGTTHSEREVAAALRSQLGPHDSMLTGLRLTDPRHGDVEADIVLLLADCGVAVIEVKGGQVEYRDGQWLVSRPGYERRTNPVEQARRAKHALRRFLDRQPEWSHGLVHAEWFVALPQMSITGDLGPEGLSDHLLCAVELNDGVERIRRRLREGHGPARPLPDEWVDVALSLLMRRPSAPAPMAHRGHRTRWAVALATAAAAAAIIATLVTRGGVNAPTELYSPGTSPTAASRACSPNYEPCVPSGPDLDCPEIGFRVTVVGRDEFALDRDGDGVACETMGN